MSTTYFETYVPAGGKITLPPEFDDAEIVVFKKHTPFPLPKNNDHWKKPKSLEQLAEEQGIEPLTDPDRIFGSLAHFWKDQEDVEDFLRQSKEARG